LPACSTVPAADAGSMVIPQTGSILPAAAWCPPSQRECDCLDCRSA
jgi:hypothetical protein